MSTPSNCIKRNNQNMFFNYSSFLSVELFPISVDPVHSKTRYPAKHPGIDDYSDAFAYQKVPINDVSPGELCFTVSINSFVHNDFAMLKTLQTYPDTCCSVAIILSTDVPSRLFLDGIEDCPHLLSYLVNEIENAAQA